MNEKVQMIIAGAFAIVFIILAVIAVFGGGKAGSAYLKGYVLEVQECRYMPSESKVEPRHIVDNEVCEVDKNRAKRDIADGLVMLFIAGIPAKLIGYIGYRRYKQLT